MQHAPTGKVYLAKEIDEQKLGNPTTHVISEGRRFQLDVVYRDDANGLREAQEMAEHLEKRIGSTKFVVLRLIQTSEGDYYERVPNGVTSRKKATTASKK